MFVLLGLGDEDAFVPVVIFLLTATVIPVAVVHHHSVKFGNTDGDAVRREDRARPSSEGYSHTSSAWRCFRSSTSRTS